MTEATQNALIISIAPTLAAVTGLIVSLKNRSKLTALHIDLNSRLSELLKAHGASERAEGVLEGRKLGVSENQSRVIESERVQDRADEKAGR